EAALAARMLAEPGEQGSEPGLLRRRAAHQVERVPGLARAEAGAAHVALVPAGVLVVIAAIADDRRPPHARRLAGDLAEQRVEHFRVGAHGFGLYRADEVRGIP